VFEGVDYALKRTFDLVLSTVFLIVLAPALLAIADRDQAELSRSGDLQIAPPGHRRKPFYCFKFRTMREHAEQIQADLEPLNEQDGALFKIRHDPRLTRVGRMLRHYSLDELPPVGQRDPGRDVGSWSPATAAS